MTPQMLRAALKDLSMTQIRAAEFLRVRPTTVNRWVRGTRKVPGPVAAAIECLRDRRELEARIGNQRIFSTTSTAPAEGGAASFIAAIQQRRDNRPPKP